MKRKLTTKTINCPINNYNYTYNYLFLFTKQQTKKQQNKNIKKTIADFKIIDYTCSVEIENIVVK